MSVTSQQHDDLTYRSGSNALELLVELDPAADSAMLRVLTVLARRRFSVRRASFAPDPETGCDLLHVELDAPRHLRDNLIAWVSALVPVRSVRVQS